MSSLSDLKRLNGPVYPVKRAWSIRKWHGKWVEKRNVHKKNTWPGTHLRDFMHATSMHGLKYVAEKEATLPERLLWMTLFVISFSTAIFFIIRMWSKWETSPVLISIETTDYPNSQVYFPAVSICNVNKISHAKLQKAISDEGNQITEDDFKILVLELMGSSTASNDEERLKHLEHVVKLTNATTATLIKFMKSMSQSCSKMIPYCEWQNERANCSMLFQLTPSNQGFCCVFNSKTIYLDNNSKDVDNEPLRTFGEGMTMGLTILLDAYTEDYAVTTSSYYGFKVLIHHPEDQPNPAKGFAIAPGNEVFAAIRTTSTFSTEEVLNLKPRQRNCRFNFESNLQYFSKYTQSNCHLEQMAKRIYEECKCLPFYFLVGNMKSSTCSFIKTNCIKAALRKYHNDADYRCPVNCNSTSYSVEISNGQFPNKDFNKTNIAHHLDPELQEELYLQRNIALLHLYFKDRSGILYRRDVRYEWQDFVSAVGGLIGLAIGFSLLSLVEIFYFCGLRWCLRRMDGKTQHNIRQHFTRPQIAYITK